MLISDTLMMLALTAFCVGWWFRLGKPVSSMMWGIVAVALLASAVGVAQGRWQAVVGGGVAMTMGLSLVARSRHSAEISRMPVLSTIALVVTVAVAYLPLYLLPIFEMPTPTGPHPVGTRTFFLEDASRTGVMEASADQTRRLMVRVWYPAEQPGAVANRYASREEIETSFAGLATQFGMPPFFFSHAGLVRSHSYEEAEVMHGEAPLPVVYFSHGYMSYAAQNSVLMELLASHGYLVFAIAHPYDCAPIRFPDGTLIRPPAEAFSPEQSEDGTILIPESQRKFYAGADYDERYQGMHEYFAEMIEKDDRLLRSAEVWLADRLFVSESLANKRAPEGMIDVIDRGDFNRVAHIGMSFGGSTSAALGYEDPRCVAAVNMDGGDFHRRSVNRPSPVPLLMFHSDWRYFADVFGHQGEVDTSFGFNDFSYERHDQAGQTDDVYRLRVKNVKHIGISDYPLMLRPPVSEILVGSIDPESMIKIINDFVLGFLDRYLREVENDFPESQFNAHRDDVVAHDASKVRTWWQAKSREQQAALESRIAEVLFSQSEEQASE